MSPLVKLLLLVAVAVAVWYVVTRLRSAQQNVSFTPVEDLPADVRATIDAALSRGEGVTAIRHYRAATGAGLAASKAAVETHRWKGGA